MVRTKVFVGNLSFKIRENQLSELFSQAGKVTGVNIITRGDRSLGYGFVEMESEEEAHKSVELLNKKEVEGRQINVEVAKPKPEGEGAPAPGASGSERAPRARRPRAPRAPAAGAGSPAPGAEGEAAPRPPRARAPRAPRARAPQPEGSAPADGSGPSGEKRARQPRAPREPRAPRPEQGPRTPSSTTLFVANLPFNVDDKGLETLFSGLAIKSSHVVMKRNGRSKGFGFVEFNNDADQNAGLQQVDGREVDGRKLIAKVALNDNVAQLTGETQAEQK